MNITIIGRKCTPRENFKERVEKKLAKLNKFFPESADAKVTASVEKTSQSVEITVSSNGMLYRAQARAQELNDALDSCVDVLVRQIRKNKTKLERRIHTGALEDYIGEAAEPDVPFEEETDFQVVRRKTIAVKPQSVDEAILQMNMLGHKFYLFRNADDGLISLVYARDDGGYGLISPETE